MPVTLAKAGHKYNNKDFPKLTLQRNALYVADFSSILNANPQIVSSASFPVYQLLTKVHPLKLLKIKKEYSKEFPPVPSLPLSYMMLHDPFTVFIQ